MFDFFTCPLYVYILYVLIGAFLPEYSYEKRHRSTMSQVRRRIPFLCRNRFGFGSSGVSS